MGVCPIFHLPTPKPITCLVFLVEFVKSGVTATHIELGEGTKKIVKYASRCTYAFKPKELFVISERLAYCMLLQRTAQTGRIKIESLIVNHEFSQDVIKSIFLKKKSGISDVVLVVINAEFIAVGMSFGNGKINKQ